MPEHHFNFAIHCFSKYGSLLLFFAINYFFAIFFINLFTYFVTLSLVFVNHLCMSYNAFNKYNTYNEVYNLCRIYKV